MDELISLSSSCSPRSPAASFFSAAGDPALVFMSCDVPEQWLLADVDSAWAAGSSFSAGYDMLPARTNATAQRRGRKPGPRSDVGPVLTHVEAERQRRDKLNRRFCDLRAAVPTVSRMDKASLLADAAAYITQLRGRVEALEADAKKAAAARTAADAAAGPGLGEKLEVRMVGRDAAAVRLTTPAARHAPARLMAALRALDLAVQHACVSRVGAVTVQDAVVDVPAASLQDVGRLHATLLHSLAAGDLK